MNTSIVEEIKGIPLNYFATSITVEVTLFILETAVDK